MLPVSSAATLILLLLCATANLFAETGRDQVRAVEVGYEIPAHLSPEEQSWYRTFQEGNILSIGWQEISAELLAKTPPEEQAAQRLALDNLGRKIGLEWCKPNAVRRVNSAMLKEWGDILRKTARTNPEQLSWAIALIDSKVEAALN